MGKKKRATTAAWRAAAAASLPLPTITSLATPLVATIACTDPLGPNAANEPPAALTQRSNDSHARTACPAHPAPSIALHTTSGSPNAISEPHNASPASFSTEHEPDGSLEPATAEPREPCSMQTHPASATTPRTPNAHTATPHTSRVTPNRAARPHTTKNDPQDEVGPSRDKMRTASDAREGGPQLVRTPASPVPHTHAATPPDVPAPPRLDARPRAPANELKGCPGIRADDTTSARTYLGPSPVSRTPHTFSTAPNDVPTLADNDLELPTPGIEPGEPHTAAGYATREESASPRSTTSTAPSTSAQTAPSFADAEPDFIHRVHHDDIVAIAIRKGFDAGLKDGRNTGFREGLEAGTKTGRGQGRKEGLREERDAWLREGHQRSGLEVSQRTCIASAVQTDDVPLAFSTSHSLATPTHLATSIEEIDAEFLECIREKAEDQAWHQGCDGGMMLGRANGYREGYEAAMRDVSTTNNVPIGIPAADTSPTNTKSSAHSADSTPPAPCLAPEERKIAWKEGREEGFNEGLEAGKRMGMLEGRERGLCEGRVAGLKDGREQGREEVRRIARTSRLVQTDPRTMRVETSIGTDVTPKIERTNTAIQTNVVFPPRTVSLASQTDVVNGGIPAAVIPPSNATSVPRPAPTVLSSMPGFEPGGPHAAIASFIKDPNPALLDPVVATALNDSHAAGLKEGRNAGLQEGIAAGRKVGTIEGRERGFDEGKSAGVRVGRELERAAVRRIPRTSRLVQTDDSPMLVHLDAAVRTPDPLRTTSPPNEQLLTSDNLAPFSWADDADSLPISTLPPLCSTAPRDFSSLHSDTVVQPFGSIQRRVRRSQRRRAQALPFCQYRTPPPALTSWRSSMPLAHPVYPVQGGVSSLDWSTDPRLSELARVLHDLGWVQSSVSSGQGSEATRTLPCWRGAHGVGRQGLPPSRGWVSSGG